jgi:response regulator RpfG family c-di-GMP phosphodiesterase
MGQNGNTDMTNILFVDDEENVLKSLKRVFMDEPYDLVTALSGKAALEILDKTNFAVIVSDQRMPEMSGSEFLGKARVIQPDAVRVVLTGYADVQAAVSAINEGGAYRYIAKPWNDTDLMLVIRDAVATYGLKQENARLTELTKKQNDEMKKWNTELEVLVQEQTIDIQNKNKELEKLNEQLRNNFRKSIEAFSGLIEMRERSVSSHSKNVASLSRQIAANMKLPEQETSNILVAALLHDIGKIGIPDAVLMKRPDDMTIEELDEYRKHAVRGQVAVDAINGFSDIGLLIRHHHEHVDGSGHPDGLKGSSIPLGSRIIAIADVFDRMTNIDKPSAEGLLKALKNIEYNLETHYDRSIYQHLSLIVTKKIEELEKQGDVRSEEVEILPHHLTTGMVLARDVRSGSGLLILARGTLLDPTLVGALQRYHQMDPSRAGIFVRKAEKQRKRPS